MKYRVRIADNRIQWYVEATDSEGNYEVVKVFYSKEKADNYVLSLQ